MVLVLFAGLTWFGCLRTLDLRGRPASRRLSQAMKGMMLPLREALPPSQRSRTSWLIDSILMPYSSIARKSRPAARIRSRADPEARYLGQRVVPESSRDEVHADFMTHLTQQ